MPAGPIPAAVFIARLPGKREGREEMKSAILRISRKYNLHPVELQLINGGTGYRFEFDSIEEYSAFIAVFRKIKGTHIDGNRYAWTFTVCKLTDHDACQSLNDRKSKLLDVFWSRYHMDHDQNAAKQAQIDFCTLHPEYMDVYNMIYA